MRREGTHDVPAEVSFHFRHREGPVATTCSFEVLTEASQHVPCTCHTLLDETICVECDIASEAWTSLDFNVECQLGLSSLPRLTVCVTSLAWFGVQCLVFYLASGCLSSVGMSRSLDKGENVISFVGIYVLYLHLSFPLPSLV